MSESPLTSQGKLWEVALNVPLPDTFTYEASEDLKVQPGDPVKVPFGPKNRKVQGLVIGPTEAKESSKDFKTKTIAEKDPEKIPLSKMQIKWLQWISDYYVYPLGQVQQSVFPPLKKKSNRKSRKKDIVPDVEPITAPDLTDEQKSVLSEIDVKSSETYLLHGVTGSGKTEVYIEVIEQVIASGKKAMVLVPEISLTPQLVRRFAERFQDQIAVLHSHLTDREKTDQWWQIVEGDKKLLIGARSALFCPVPNLGVIVVDEEHETSFKQEEKLKYNARDVAIVRAKMEKCPIILGSATPSLESWQNAKEGKFKLLTLKNRVSNRPLPEVTIVNPREDRDEHNELPYWLSETLFKKLKNTFENSQQTALFLNRRGIAPNVQCYDCGFSYECPNCDISLTLHGKHHLVCHYCNYHERKSDECPDCKEGEPKAYGLGTEAVEKGILELFPEARVFRADRDEIQSREALEEMVRKMENSEIDFLIGTQMIAKGLDFKNLTLVGIIHADVAFNIPDFRASERGYQLCTQVSGRAGRHAVPGEVVIQTYKKEHPSLQAVKNHNYYQFVEEEAENRKLFHYPPFGKITSIRVSGLREQEVIEESQALANYLKQLIEKYDQLGGVQVLGPTPSPLTKIKNRFRYHLLIKAKDHQTINHIAKMADQFIRDQCKKTKCLIDVDPYTLL